MRRTIVALLLVGVAVQLAGLIVAAFGTDLRGPQSEDMVPFTYLLATIASVLAAVIAMAGSVLILSLTLGTSVQRSHLGSMILGDEDFRIAVAGAIVTILAAVPRARVFRPLGRRPRGDAREGPCGLLRPRRMAFRDRDEGRRAGGPLRGAWGRVLRRSLGLRASSR
jgi:hypothetical protein